MIPLKHSPRGYLRSLQISSTELFVFVEGPSDRYFYDSLCQTVCPVRRVSYEVRAANELPAQTGGKRALLQFFDRLRESRLLFTRFKEKDTCLLFFLDKDVDDCCRTMRRSIHVAYTEFHCMENYLFRYTDLSDVAAAAASLDRASMVAQLGVDADWRARAAREWIEWVKMCVLAAVMGARCEVNYGQESLVNTAPYGGLVRRRLRHFQAVLRRASGLDPRRFRVLRARTARYVERLYGEGRHDSVFKGKWYAKFLDKDISTAAGSRQYDRNSLPTRIIQVALAKLDFRGEWANAMRLPLTRMSELVRHANGAGPLRRRV